MAARLAGAQALGHFVTRHLADRHFILCSSTYGQARTIKLHAGPSIKWMNKETAGWVSQ